MFSRVFVLSLILTGSALACDAHPGLPHEKWKAWVDGLNAQYEAEQKAKAAQSTASASGFTSDVPGKSAAKTPPATTTVQRPLAEERETARSLDPQVRTLRSRDERF